MTVLFTFPEAVQSNWLAAFLMTLMLATSGGALIWHSCFLAWEWVSQTAASNRPKTPAMSSITDIEADNA